jgi:hypothetical protein
MLFLDKHIGELPGASDDSQTNMVAKVEEVTMSKTEVVSEANPL